MSKRIIWEDRGTSQVSDVGMIAMALMGWAAYVKAGEAFRCVGVGIRSAKTARQTVEAHAAGDMQVRRVV